MFYILNKEVQESYEGLGDYKKEKEEAQNIKKEEEERKLYERLKSKYDPVSSEFAKKLP